MKNAAIFPGQGAQLPGMGKDLYDSNPKAKELFEQANEILGFRITDIMFGEDEEALQATNVTQPAVFLHSAVAALCNNVHPDMTAGHSLGEFSALAAAEVLSLEDALHLVSVRARAMQKCCEKVPGAMAAIIGADQSLIEETCEKVKGTVVAANYNCDTQVVISGEEPAVDAVIEALGQAGVRKMVKLKVGGAFHSPLMEPARAELAQAIDRIHFHNPICPVYQNVDGLAHTSPAKIKEKLLQQLTSPVYWTSTIRNMVSDGATTFTVIGPGKVLQGLNKKIIPEIETLTLS